MQQRLSGLWTQTWFKALVIGTTLVVLLGLTFITGVFRPQDHIGRRNFIVGGSTSQTVTITPTVSPSPASGQATAARPSATATPRATVAIQVAPTNALTVIPPTPIPARTNTPLPPPPPPASPTPSTCAQLKAQGKSIAGAWMYVQSGSRFIRSATYKFGAETLTGVEQGGMCQTSNGRWYKP